MTGDKNQFEALFQMALEASARSYSPYSHFPVGAAVLFENGEVVTGCNVENRSFGLTNCAERSAVYAGVSRGLSVIKAVAIAAPKADYPVGPCGACRQVLTEFGDGKTPVVFGPDFERARLATLEELYPYDSLHELK